MTQTPRIYLINFIQKYASDEYESPKEIFELAKKGERELTLIAKSIVIYYKGEGKKIPFSIPKPKQKYYTLKIPFTENDAQELLSGESFDWTFETEEDPTISINCKITKEEYEN